MTDHNKKVVTVNSKLWGKIIQSYQVDYLSLLINHLYFATVFTLSTTDENLFYEWKCFILNVLVTVAALLVLHRVYLFLNKTSVKGMPKQSILSPF